MFNRPNDSDLDPASNELARVAAAVVVVPVAAVTGRDGGNQHAVRVEEQPGDPVIDMAASDRGAAIGRVRTLSQAATVNEPGKVQSVDRQRNVQSTSVMGTNSKTWRPVERKVAALSRQKPQGSNN